MNADQKEKIYLDLKTDLGRCEAFSRVVRYSKADHPAPVVIRVHPRYTRGKLFLPLLYSHRLRQVSRLIHVAAAANGDVIRQQL
jgi:hypothetical protein